MSYYSRFSNFTFSLAENKNPYTPIPGTKWGKVWETLYLQRKLPTQTGSRHLSIHFISFRQRHFHLLIKKYVPNPFELEIKDHSFAPKNSSLTEALDQRLSTITKYKL